MKPFDKLPSGSATWRVTWLLPATLLVGCKTLPPAPPTEVKLPALPQLSTPLPSRAYSESAAQNFRIWQQELTDTSRISEH